MGEQVNRIANAGGRVIIATLPDMGVTPFALKEKAAKVDTDRAAFLSTLTTEFNTAMRLTTLTYKNGAGSTLASYVYGYDAGSRLTSESINGKYRASSYAAPRAIAWFG